MKLNTPHRGIKSIDLLPLINVVFLLILFVLIAGRPATNHPQGVRVAQSRVATAHKPAALAVTLTAQNEFFLGADGPKTATEIADYLRGQNFVEQNLPVELIADHTSKARALLDFRAALAKAGIGEIRLKTEYVGGRNEP